MCAGIHWFNHLFSLGIASNHLCNEEFEQVGFTSARCYHPNGSYSYPISQKLTLRSQATWFYAKGFNSATGMLYAVTGSVNEFSIGFGYRSASAIIASITKRFGRFYGGYFIEYFTNPFVPGQFAHEFRVAFELFDKGILPK